MTWFVAIFVVLGIFLLFVSPYSRKATVEGYLKTETGTAKIFALQRGTITNVQVSEGQDVEKGQPLLTIDTTQITATGEDVNVVILDTLLAQRDQLNRQIAGEEQQMASEQERLTLLIEGLKNEITQIEAQIPLQQNRISISDSLVESVAQLVRKGAVTDVEYKRRQADALDQRQGLNSQRQQLAAKQNELTNNQYSLSQLPTVTAGKIQLLRNELSTIEQRITEINGRRAFVIRAPMAGRVTALQASVGKMAEPNQLQLEIVPTELQPQSRAVRSQPRDRLRARGSASEHPLRGISIRELWPLCRHHRRDLEKHPHERRYPIRTGRTKAAGLSGHCDARSARY